VRLVDEQTVSLLLDPVDRRAHHFAFGGYRDHVAAQVSQVSRRLGLGCGGDYDSDAVWESLRQPELQGRLFAGLGVVEVLDAFDHDDDVAVENDVLPGVTRGYFIFLLHSSSQ